MKRIHSFASITDIHFQNSSSLQHVILCLHLTVTPSSLLSETPDKHHCIKTFCLQVPHTGGVIQYLNIKFLILFNKPQGHSSESPRLSTLLHT